MMIPAHLLPSEIQRDTREGTWMMTLMEDELELRSANRSLLRAAIVLIVLGSILLWGAWAVNAAGPLIRFNTTSATDQMGVLISPYVSVSPQTVGLSSNAVLTCEAVVNGLTNPAPMTIRWQLDAAASTPGVSATLSSPSAFSTSVGSWSAIGTYIFRANLRFGAWTNSSGTVTAVVTFAPSNPPTATITSPADAATFQTGANIVITASATAPAGSVSYVSFYRNGSLLGSDASSPYAWTISGQSYGNWTLQARTTDNLGAAGTSADVRIVVNPDLFLTWDAGDIGVAPPYILDWKLYKAVGAGAYSLLATRTVKNYTDTNLSAGSYHYRVSSRNTAGESAYSPVWDLVVP